MSSAHDSNSSSIPSVPLTPTMSSTTTHSISDIPRRTISPYDLSPSDNPGLVLTQTLLRGTNYDEWAINIRHALKSRKKFGFVDDLWDYLKRRFGMTNAPRFLRLRSALANCRQTGMSVEAYFGKLTKLWDDLASLRTLKLCLCGHS
ncbi:PREDICTED: uncharacterized protein LOC104825437 [Tarenaya hassleriana]|uniref:uncharacterized protein LOC104825437 n=1 Tax=Tarenaya hassleriana TaxID=28532 RepID=UPI00053C413F|nr:PREDICTED: uncharacterized protein LOC104825437 [Tarenaya hassleriana]